MLNTVAVLALLAAGGPVDEPQGPPAPAVDRNGFSLPPGAVARLGDPDRRHRLPSDWVAFSDDDRLLARPVESIVTIFDLDRKRDVSPGYLKDHPNAVLRFLPDGRHLLYTQSAKRCEVRDPSTGRVAIGFEVPNASSTSDMLTSTDGKRVLVKFRDNNGYSCAVVADLSDSPPSTKAFRGSSSSDQWVLSADGKRLFQGWERGIAAYDAGGGDRLAFAASRYRSTYPLVATADGAKVIAGWDRGVVSLDLTADGFSEPAATNIDATDDFTFAPDGKTMVRAGIGVYDAKGVFTPVEPAHDRSNLRMMRYSRTTARCVDLFYDRPPVVWDPHTGKTVYRFEQEYAAGVGLGVAVDGTVSLRYADRTVRVFTQDGKLIAERTGRANVRATVMLGLSPDGTTSVEYDGKDRKLFSYDTSTSTGTAWPQEFPNSPHTVRFDATGRRAYVAGNGYAGVFDVNTGRRVRSAEVAGIAAFSDDGRTLAIVGKKEVRVYEVASGKERVTAEIPATDFDTQDENRFSRSRWGDDEEGPALLRGQMQFSADSGKVAVFWTGGRVSVFDATDGNIRFRESRQWNATRIAALRPDGEWFATTTRTTRRIALRSTTDSRADRNAIILTDCKSAVVALAFTPDGKRLVSAHDDGTALVWDVEAAIKAPPVADPEPGETLWVGLASSDAKVAGRAVNGLIARPDVAVTLLAEMARPVMPPPAERVKAAVANLGDRDFKVREEAEKQLRVWGDLVADELSAAEPTANAEQGERIRRLLDTLEAEETDTERLRLLRTVEVLERIGSPSTKAVLEKLGTGAAASIVTREAKEALKRLKDRGR